MLAYSQVGDVEAPRTAMILHGILGCGRNWRSMARRLVAANPDWSVVLLDLRGHGASFTDRPDAAPPHTLAACARDVMTTIAGLGRPVDAIIGHSFGGKVALTYARDYGRGQGVGVVWVLDTPPGRSTGPAGEVGLVLRTLAAMPEPLERREQLTEAFETAGIAHLAGWMSTNLRRLPEGGFGFRFSLEIVRDLLDDYQRRSAWRYLRERRDGLVVHLLRATAGDRWLADERQLLEEARSWPDTVVHDFDAGHWVHVDDPDGLLLLLSESLPRSAGVVG